MCVITCRYEEVIDKLFSAEQMVKDLPQFHLRIRVNLCHAYAEVCVGAVNTVGGQGLREGMGMGGGS